MKIYLKPKRRYLDIACIQRPLLSLTNIPADQSVIQQRHLLKQILINIERTSSTDYRFEKVSAKSFNEKKKFYIATSLYL